MRTPLLLQPDYTVYRGYYQIKLPLEMDAMIPADDSVRLLSAFVEGMDLSELYATYDRVRKKKAGNAGPDYNEIRYTAAHEQEHTG